MDLLSKLLQRMRELNATDLLLSPGCPPAFRVDGRLQLAEQKPLASTQVDRMTQLVMTPEQYEGFLEDPEANFGIALPRLGRFRINVYRRRGETAMAIRAVPTTIPDFASLGLPATLEQIAMLRRGMVIVAGPAGTGKSTTLAALTAYRARNDLGHIITVEDPVEFEISGTPSIVSQREIGKDTRSYEKALNSALRQSPDVLVIGEARDHETVMRAIEFSDTGHLCMLTIHANNAAQTFERISRMFREEERERILGCLGANVKAVLCQNLVMATTGQRVLAYELLLSTPRIADLVRKGQIWELREVMEKSNVPGMRSFDDSLYELHARGIIDEDTALEHAYSVNNLRLRMKLGRGREDSAGGPVGKAL